MLNSHKKGFSLVEVMIIVIVISILAGITVAAFNTQQKHSRDTRAASSALALSTALNNYYAERGNYPISCDVGTAEPLKCSNLSSTYTGSDTSPLGIMPASTIAYLKNSFPEIDDNFTHPRNDSTRVINQLQGSLIANNSFFLLSMDMVPGSPTFPGPIDPCPRGFCSTSNNTEGDNSTNLASNATPNIEVLNSQASTVGFQNPAGGSFTCSFELTGRNSGGSISVRPHQYVIGFVGEVENKWQFYISPLKIDNNILDWNNTNSANCAAKNLDELKTAA